MGSNMKCQPGDCKGKKLDLNESLENDEPILRKRDLNEWSEQDYGNASRGASWI